MDDDMKTETLVDQAEIEPDPIAVMEVERLKDHVGCWYLPFKAEQVYCYGIVDTGTGYSLVSDSCFNALPRKCRTALEPAQVNLVNADGHKLMVKGKSSLSLSAEGQNFNIDVIVAKSLGSLQIILGIDFLSAHGMTLDAANGVLTCQGKNLELHQKSKNFDNVVLVSEDQEIPAKKEVWVKGSILGKWDQKNDRAFLASIAGMIEKQLTLFEALVAITKEGNLLICFCNNGSDDVTLLSQSPVAEVRKIDQIAFVNPAEAENPSRSNPTRCAETIASSEEPKVSTYAEEIVVPEHLVASCEQSEEGWQGYRSIDETSPESTSESEEEPILDMESLRGIMSSLKGEKTGIG